jgi:iron complex transport system ATP-binding protein
MTGAPLLSARGLTFKAGTRTILGPLDLEVFAGECLMVVGPNGAGKTTLLRLLTGLLAPSGGAEGEVFYLGRPLGSLPRRERARHIAYVPQVRPASVPLTVFEVVLLGRYPHLSPLQLAPRAADFAAAEEALAMGGIADLRDRPIDQLSGGERQAVYIAAALAQEAEILVLDEPTTHLDARHQREVAALLVKLKGEAGRTVVAATHDLNLASLLGDRLLALSGGRVLAVGSPAEILRPDLLRALFGTRFEVVRGGERPVTLLELAP